MCDVEDRERTLLSISKSSCTAGEELLRAVQQDICDVMPLWNNAQLFSTQKLNKASCIRRATRSNYTSDKAHLI